MRRSKADTALTRQHIVETAAQLFLEKGVAAAGIADVMAAAGLTPGGFYRHFESKEQLVAEANQVMFQWLRAKLDEISAGQPPREALHAIAELYLAQVKQGALCPLTKLGGQLEFSDHAVQATIMAGYEGFVSYFATHTRAMGVAEPDNLARALVSTLVGAVTLSRLASDATVEQSVLDSAQHVVDVLLAQ